MVEVRGVGKRYRLGIFNRQQFTDDVKAWTAKLLGRPDPTMPVGLRVDPQRIGEDFWALRDISFDVHQGEVVGIIGHNGAGKSTMLKLLSRITLPTEGTIKMKGRVSCLLEVGTGFHPELTGRDNVYLNGAILGMTRAEVDTKIDKIIAFSGITDHIDTPVKRYSSGMRVRLGFAVAAHLEPEILIVDEVLSVGDAEFRRKSMGKMRETAQDGRTVLFVSHNMTAIRSLCSRVIWLDKGHIRMQGDTEEVVAAYLENYSTATNERVWRAEEAPGSDVARLHHVRIRPANGGDTFQWDDAVDVEVGLVVYRSDNTTLNIQVLNGDDLVVFTSNSWEGLANRYLEKGEQVLGCRFPGHLFNAGEYRLNVGISFQGKRNFREDQVVSFKMVEPPRDGAWHGRRKGLFRLQIPWHKREESSSVIF